MLSENRPRSPFDPVNSRLYGRNLIEASAGTGKTFTITRIFMRLLLENELPLHSLLTVTFTDAATAELRERIYVLIKEAITAFKSQQSEDPLLCALIKKIPSQKALALLTTALTNFDNCAVYTIHAFCQRLLSDYSFESGSTFDATLVTDQHELINEAAEDFWRITFHEASETLIRYLVSRKIAPAYFAKIYSICSSRSNLTFVPDTNPVDFKPAETAFKSLYTELAQLWPSSRPEVMNLLCSGSLKATKYKESVISEMDASMEHFCARNTPQTDLFKSFSNFTTTMLREYTKKGAAAPSHRFFDLCEAFFDMASELSKLYSSYFDHLCKESVKIMENRISSKKEEQNVLFFDDLLKRVLNTIRSGERGSKFVSAVSKKFKAALIDEFQDTDPVQYEIFNELFASAETAMFFIGDPKQAIYSFRGADIFTYLSAVETVTSHYTLSTNYRSDPDLVKAVTALFGLSQNPFLLKEIGISNVSGGISDPQHIVINGIKQNPLTIWFTDGDNSTALHRQLPEVVAGHIAVLTGRTGNPAAIGATPVNPSHCAILVLTNKQAFQYQDALAALSIPSVVESGSSVYSTPEAMELHYLLCAVADPSEQLISAALTLPFFGFGSSELQRFATDETFYGQIYRIFTDANSSWRESGFATMIHALFAGISLEKTILSQVSGERRITNYLHLAELLQKESERKNHHITALTGFLAERIMHCDENEPDDDIIRLESDDSAVRILTVHKSKGLEFDIVFCPTLAIARSDRRKNSDPYVVHDTSQNPSRTLLILGEEARDTYKPLLDSETLAERLRLFYVALTRAKSACYMIYDSSDDAHTSALSWLLFGDGLAAPQVQELRSHLKQLSSNEIYNRLNAVRDLISNLSLEPLPAIITPENFTGDDNPPNLDCRTPAAALPQPWKISSYSSLTRSAAQSLHSPFELRLDEHFTATQEQAASEQNRTIFNFPKGAAAGTFLHSVIEAIDLHDAMSGSNTGSIIEQKLLAAGMDSAWRATIETLLENLAHADFHTGENSIFLRSVDRANCVKEMEFCFPMRDISSHDIISAFSEELDLFGDNYTGDGLQFSKTGGFLKGFIDMIFQYDDKFYIVDWKSNHLGDSPDCYTEDKILPVMIDDHYVLQYHLYSIALDQYLRVHLAGYDYNRHFGGVFYCFLRGILPGTGNGILFRRPKVGFLERLRGILVEGL